MFFRPKRTDGADPRERALWGQLASLGTVIPIAIVLGFFIGRWIGRKLGHPEAGQWIGLVWGLATAGWELFKTMQRLDRFDAQQAREREEKEAAERARPFGDDDHGG
ncbi:MAG TPA: AtpZ/AtpI family protein [Geothrix sp.]|nr:AtpZ/AtpI family protein [Geothrix sp.]